MADTIFAVSSGSPPAAIGVIRVSGPRAGDAIQQLVGRDLASRRATLAILRDQKGTELDKALVLWFRGPNTATGEDLAEFHCHGGRAVLAAVEKALGDLEGLRAAEPGEFTRRAFSNGRIDLAESEGLADLLAAETELQRSAAMANAGGAISSLVEEWRGALLSLSAQVEAALDFSDEGDVDELPASFTANIRHLQTELREWLDRPRSEKLGEGFRVVLAGPPNSGKSTLFNALVESEAAITSPIAGTTRDVIERAIAIDGAPFVFIDTAGLRDAAGDEIEEIGIGRAKMEVDRADCVLWLGEEGLGPEGAWEISAKIDAPEAAEKSSPRAWVSAKTGQGIAELKRKLVEFAKSAFPKPGEGALNKRQHALLSNAAMSLESAAGHGDLLIIAEDLRQCRVAFDQLTGRAATEDMLDALFGRFCIGK